MGTRADFYVGVGKDAEWLGSIAWDGYEIEEADDVKTPAHRVRRAQTEADYRAAVQAFLESRDDATYPKDGWPWPWEDSNITDYAYAFVDGEVKWFNDCEQREWPNMKEKQNVQFGNGRLWLLRL